MLHDNKRRLAIFGGTFDPPHLAHRSLVEALIESGRVDAVQVLPSARPPHKTGQWITPASYRLEMAKLAFASLPGVEVSDRELQRSTPSYTYETVEDLQKEAQEQGIEQELFFVVGADSLLDFASWMQPERILRQAQLLVAQRPGVPFERCQSIAEHWNQKMGRPCVHFFSAPVLDFSSTEIRSRLHSLLSSPDTVPAGKVRSTDPPELLSLPLVPAVCTFILDHALYCYPHLGQSCSLKVRSSCHEMELALRRELTRARLLHTLDVFSFALGWSEALELPADAVAQAALLHDCAKQYSLERSLQYCPEVPSLCEGRTELYHGPVGAEVAREVYGITDPAVLDAIRWHSTLRAQATDLEEWIFVADKLEPGRTFGDLARLRSWIPRNLHRAAWETTVETQASLTRRGLPSFSHSLAYRAWAESRYGYAILTAGGDLCNPKK